MDIWMLDIDNPDNTRPFMWKFLSDFLQCKKVCGLVNFSSFSKPRDENMDCYCRVEDLKDQMLGWSMCVSNEEHQMKMISQGSLTSQPQGCYFTPRWWHPPPTHMIRVTRRSRFISFSLPHHVSERAPYLSSTSYEPLSLNIFRPWRWQNVTCLPLNCKATVVWLSKCEAA